MSTFWNDLNEEMKDPKFRQEFEKQSHFIKETDRVVNSVLDHLKTLDEEEERAFLFALRNAVIDSLVEETE